MINQKLLQQAIRRTELEAERPHEVWGIVGMTHRDGFNSRGVTRSILAREARARLLILRGLYEL